MMTQGAIEHNESNIPLTLEELIETEMSWKIETSSGVFADETTQPGDIIQYQVESIDKENEIYKIKASKKGWGKNDFELDTSYDEPSYYFVKRAWGEIAVDYFILPDGVFWGNVSWVDQNYIVEYLTEWYNGLLINTITINLKMDDTNYDIIKYTRAEGILISRVAAVDFKEGKVRGNLKVDLQTFSGIFALSPWWYIILFIMIASACASVFVVISILVQRRKRMWREIDEI